MKLILILGAAGQVGELVSTKLLNETDFNIVLFARNASSRIKIREEKRETAVNGDFTDKASLINAMKGIDAIYLNDMGSSYSTQVIVDAMKESGVKRIIGATVLGIYNEVAGKFGEWNNRMIGNSSRMAEQIKSAKIIESSGLDYTLLRLTWLYDEEGNENYTLTRKGEPFVGTQVTREAVAKLIVDILTAKDDKYIGKSLGVSEPNTNWDKPSFY